MSTIWPDISERRLRPELMDDPSLDASEHRRALAGLQRLNAVSGAVRAVWSGLRGAARRAGELTVLDVAAGSGDVAIGLARRARAEGVHVEMHAADLSPVALETAREAAACAGVSLTLHRMDVLRDPMPGEYDAVCCSLFMHHLSESDALGLLYRMRSAARRLVVVSDLERTRMAAVLAYLGSRLLTRSRVVRTDAMLSVAAAFTISEFAELAAEAGLAGVEVQRHFPARFVFVWKRPA
ncbi:MAG: methyltransferase domain-containing protein [Phycisphaerae bacterium]|nr:methyltransferase domain-containing protein [Phycisphaerae bacterium]